MHRSYPAEKRHAQPAALGHRHLCGSPPRRECLFTLQRLRPDRSPPGQDPTELARLYPPRRSHHKHPPREIQSHSLRVWAKIPASSIWLPWRDGVVPFAVETGWLYVESSHFGIGDPDGLL